MTRKTEPFRPLLVHSRGSIVEALVARRYALGLRGEDLDELAGWADRYTGKIERPQRPGGKPSFHLTYGTEVLPTGAIAATQMGDVWMQALGVRLVLVDAETANRIGAVPAPPLVKRRGCQRGGDVSHAHSSRRQDKGIRSAMTIDAYEAADRTRIAALTLRHAVTGHPLVVERPALLERAEAIERSLQDLAHDIGEAS